MRERLAIVAMPRARSFSVVNRMKTLCTIGHLSLVAMRRKSANKKPGSEEANPHAGFLDINLVSSLDPITCGRIDPISSDQVSPHNCCTGDA